MTLGELCEIARGGSPRPIKEFQTDDPNGIPWIKISDATASSKYIYKTKEKIRPEGIKRSRLVKEGDFLLSNSMSFGRPYIMRTSGCIHDGWLVLSDKTSLFDQDYLYHFLSSANAYRQFDSLAAGSTVRNLNIDLVKGVKVSLPLLPEQKRIVAILDEAFAGIATAVANTEKNLANARELFDSYLNNVFTQKGEGWEEKRLGELCKIRTGKKDVNQGNPEGIYPFFTCAKTHTFSDVYSFDTEAILIAGNGDVGNVSYYNGKFEAYQRTYVLLDFENILPWYLYLVLDGLLKTTVSDQKLGNTMPYIKKGMLTDFAVPIPPPSEQKRIVSRLNALSSETQRLESIY